MTRRGRPPGTPQGRESARETLYRERARLAKLKADREEGVTVRLDEADERYGRLVTAFRDTRLRLPGELVQRGWIPRERETDVEGLVHHALNHLALHGRRKPWTPPGSARSCSPPRSPEAGEQSDIAGCCWQNFHPPSAAGQRSI